MHLLQFAQIPSGASVSKPGQIRILEGEIQHLQLTTNINSVDFTCALPIILVVYVALTSTIVPRAVPIQVYLIP